MTDPSMVAPLVATRKACSVDAPVDSLTATTAASATASSSMMSRSTSRGSTLTPPITSVSSARQR
ncbi:Uncharacterised protein [Mycobacterium tuberculosis]|nr:Uncharacterised protein [Mycobacterium tuberculosis]CPA85636.1 Uncharacterised protein [Mycobacterium tuberculosis]